MKLERRRIDMKLKFVIDKQEDEKISKIMGIPIDYVQQQYKTSLKFLKLSQKMYQKSWDEINNDFSEYVERITGYKWFYPEYKCILSMGVAGWAPWGEVNMIARYWKENPYYMRRITAHELIEAHYFEIIKRYYSHEKLKDGQIWAIAEIAAWALTSLTPEVKKWWPWNTEYYTNHNYPHVVKIQLKLKDKFLKRRDFDEYIQEGIKLIKKYPNMDTKGYHKTPGNIYNRGIKK
ncbi:MAG: hypothetical protein NTZ83_04110 [Candidatus Pacearchaeota archaeon]|nr:hypothetical protein [Candidatus Pacearchaeota archaeon]